LNDQAYNDYIASKYRNQKLIEERTRFFKLFKDSVDKKAFMDVTEKDISDFITTFQWSLVEVQKAFDFLSEYISFIRKEQPELNFIADVINDYCLKKFEAVGKEAAVNRKKAILLIPDAVKIDPDLFGTLSNSQFVSAFLELQKLIIKAYEDIEKSPFEWGYPNYYATDGYYNRVFDFLYAFVCCGDFSNGKLTVDTKQFFSFTSVKRHKKSELMIAGFERIGFVFDDCDKKSMFFSITYPTNPRIITVLCAYIKSLEENALHWSSAEMMKWSFSYRFVEDASMQKFETVFHSKLDLASEELRKIQYWLHGEAEKYGYQIDVSHPYEKNCIQYKKGSKIFLLVGETDGNHLVNKTDKKPTVFSKIIFRNAFINQKEKITELYNKFPETFKSNCRMCSDTCKMRICYEVEGKPHKNCAYQSFVFQNLTLADVSNLLELFKTENKIK